MSLPYYKKSLTGTILMWDITNDGNAVIIITGPLMGKQSHYVKDTKYVNIHDDIKYKTKEKLDQGWTDVDDFVQQMNIGARNEHLKKTLPTNYTDSNNRLNPQKARLYNSKDANYPADIQPKINGVRCTLAWGIIESGVGMFKEYTEGAMIKSNGGLIYLLPHITDALTKDFFFTEYEGEEIEITYDGELYIPGKSLTFIKSSVPYINKSGITHRASNPTNKVSFYCFDLAIEHMLQIYRLLLKDALLEDYPSDNLNINIDSPIVNLITTRVNNETEAFAFKDMCLKLGYEGAILRHFNYTYQFGKKNNCMLKLKQWFYTNCIILDVINKGVTEIEGKKRTYVALLLRNDLNNGTFECTPEGDEQFRINLLKNSDHYIGRVAEVKFRERSETGNFPFQANVTKIH
jgi:hypothetical protein